MRCKKRLKFSSDLFYCHINVLIRKMKSDLPIYTRLIFLFCLMCETFHQPDLSCAQGLYLPVKANVRAREKFFGWFVHSLSR